MQLQFFIQNDVIKQRTETNETDDNNEPELWVESGDWHGVGVGLG